uniref:Trafficking protein particle complex subunit 12 n=3 Tax=Lygus hesperus TaxID=30085 RepID=A0A0A9XAH5_LYGHE
MSDQPKQPSLEKYFSGSAQNDNFFDQLPVGSRNNPQISAMMSSMIESKSTQDLFASSQSSPSISTKMGELNLDTSEPEISACKIFANESKVQNSSFFDMISPSGSDTVDGFQSDPTDVGSSGSIFSYDINNEGPYPSPLQGFEDMSEIFNGAECDRTREAWIPSDATRRALIMAATSPPGMYAADKDILTMPGVLLEEEMVDSVGQLMRQLYGESEAANRKVLTMSDVSEDEMGLRELIQCECYRAAVNLTGKLLAIFGQGLKKQGQPSKHSVKSIQIWFTRFCLLVKLQDFQTADMESTIWWDLDKPDLYYQFYPERYGGKLGTMVPFQMRILIANIPAYLQKYSLALSRLYSILAVVRQILTNLENGKTEDGSLIELSSKERHIAKQLWASREARVQHSIVNVALMSKNYVLAIEVLQNLIKNNYSVNQKRALHSALGRVFLQLGDVGNAEICFNMAKKLKRGQTGTLNSNVADIRELIDKGLVSVAQNYYQDAYEYFHKASLLEPSNVMVLNNMAVCLFYTGKLRKALEVLNSTIHANPSLALHEALLLNLCTLYELESSHIGQKEALLKQVAKYKGDGINISCLKLQPQPANK